MISDEEYKRLREEHEVAYFKGDLAVSMPESYTLEEMREISEDMDASTQAIDDAMRADFESLPPEAQAKLLDMLSGSDVESREWWEQVLLGFTVPDTAPETRGPRLSKTPGQRGVLSRSETPFCSGMIWESRETELGLCDGRLGGR